MSDFEAFWLLYPRREKKGDARKAYLGALRKTGHDLMMEGLQRSIRQWAREKREPRFYPLPASWLRAECWLDEHDRPEQPTLMNGAGDAAIRAISKGTYLTNVSDNQVRQWIGQGRIAADLARKAGYLV